MYSSVESDVKMFTLLVYECVNVWITDMHLSIYEYAAQLFKYLDSLGFVVVLFLSSQWGMHL